MVDNKSKTSRIRHTENISFMKMNNITLALCTHIILLFSFIIHFFCFPIVHSQVDEGGPG